MRSAVLSAAVERWPIAGDFTISRGARTEVVVVVVEAQRDGIVGRGECVPYARYGETVDGTVAAIGGVGSVASRDALALASRLARRATQSTVHSGISKPSRRGAASGSWLALERTHHR